MTEATVTDVVIATTGRISQKMRDTAHTRFFEPPADVAPAYILDLYPFTWQAGVDYIVEGLGMAPTRWEGFGSDTRQSLLDNLARAAKLPARLLGHVYGYGVANPIASLVHQDKLAEVSEQQHLNLDPTAARSIVHVLAYLQHASTGGRVVDKRAKTADVAKALDIFEQAFSQM